MNVRFEGIAKSFGAFQALREASFDIGEGEFFTLLGPSGCGKTTLLRLIAGFHRQDRGNLRFGERLMNEVPAHKRNIGMVFQNYAIFPHLSVFDNVAYGLRARNMDKAEIGRRVAEALALVELSHLSDRSPASMSGGQQQRIALARAVVIRPALLLMDEPLSNLDAKLRIRMRTEIRALQQRLKMTTVYVTHDQEEALAVSDRIAVMDGGVIRQIGTPEQVYLQPADRTVAHFVGTSNFLQAEVVECAGSTGSATVSLGELRFMLQLRRPYKGKALLSIRPEQVRLERTRCREQLLAGTIERATFLGGKVQYAFRGDGGETLEAETPMTERGELLAQGQRVFADLQPERAVLFDGSGEEALHFA